MSLRYSGRLPPLLFVFDKHDIFVPYRENIEHLNTIFPDGMPSKIDVRVEDDIDHTFHIVEAGCVSWNEAIKNPFSNELRDFLSTWIMEKISPTAEPDH